MQEHPFQVDGEALYGEYHAPKGQARGGIVLVHGFNSCLQEFGDAPQLLADAGFHVFGYDQRGFGDSEGEEGFTSLERFEADLDAATRQLQDLAPGIALGVVAHSFGAALLLHRLGRAHPFAAVCLAHPVISPVAAVGAWKRQVMRGMGRINKVRTKRGKDNLHVTRHSDYSRLFVDPERAAASWESARYISRSVNLGVQPLVQSMDPLAWARAVDVPTLALLGPNDALIPYADSRAVVDALSCVKETVEHRGGHSLFRDLDGAYAATAAARFFTAHLGVA